MIINCPECKHQVSDKAPVCPSCGVEIAGKIKQCDKCGNIYLIDEKSCPACTNVKSKNNENNLQSQNTVVARKANTKTLRSTASGSQHQDNNKPKKRRFSFTTLVISFAIAVIAFGTLWYYYNNAQNNKEQDDYAYAVQSSDTEILKSYLLRYPNAPEEHRDTIEAHLQKILKGDEDWNNAILSNSVTSLKRYLDENPETAHRQEALNKIDSLEWIAAKNNNTEEHVREYIEQHPDGRYMDDAAILLSKIMSTKVQEDEQTMITSLFRQFFQSINTQDEERLTSSVALVMNNFLGKENATSDDVLTFLHRIYKDDITNMVWKINNESYKIKKTEVAEGEYEYDVEFLAEQDTDRSGNITTTNYRVIAKVTNDGKISDFNLNIIK